jgi:hypothetical protein
MSTPTPTPMLMPATQLMPFAACARAAAAAMTRRR